MRYLYALQHTSCTKKRTVSFLRRRGALLIEILIAIAVIGGSITFILGASALILRITTLNFNAIQAAYLAEEGVEIVRAVRDRNWGAFALYEQDIPLAVATSSGGWWLTATSSERLPYGGSRIITLGSVYRNVNDQPAVSGTLDTGSRHVEVKITLPGATSTTVLTYLSNIHE